MCASASSCKANRGRCSSMAPAGWLALAATLIRSAVSQAVPGMTGAASMGMQVGAATTATTPTAEKLTGKAGDWPAPVSDGDCTGFEEETGECSPSHPKDCTACTPVECVFSAWAQWSPASTTNCNQICTRTRKIVTDANECGTGCSGPTSETKYCPRTGPCANYRQDCKFGAWGAFTACGGGHAGELGQKTRTRPTTPAAHGGKPCNGTTKQTVPCGTSNMPIDCELTDWHMWTSCSMTCGTGIHTRTRRWAQEAKWGGRPCMGPIQQIGKCTLAACPGSTDCTATAWTQWIGCTDSHPSQKYRMRSISTPPSAGGAACPPYLKETAGCPNGTNACTFTEWEQWSACPVTCGGGQMRRNRKLVTWIKTNDQALCPDTQTQQTTGCGMGICTSETLDCQLGQWEQWSPCHPSCGNGMKSRKRVVTQEAQVGGKGCNGTLEEMLPCLSEACVKRDCLWGLWSDWGACSATCGGGTHYRTRTIKEKNRYGGKTCGQVPSALPEKRSHNGITGTYFPWAQIAPCNNVSCNSECINGTWGVWAEWSQCSATCGVGFKSRRRDLAQVPNACGSPAQGPEDEIAHCKAASTCEPKVDCELSLFSEWSDCSQTCFGVQERNRLVAKYPSGGGATCGNASLKEVRPCNPSKGDPVPSSCAALPHHDCTMTTWGQWTNCPVTCGGGQHTRARRIIQPPSGGGISCNGSLTITESCNTNKCGNHCVNCKWGQWDSWGACSQCGGQRYRTRRVEQLPNHCGTKCVARIAHETAKCPTNCRPDYWCTWATWSAYTPCSGTCGNVTKQRQRLLQIMRKMPPDGDFLFHSEESLMCAGTQFEVKICGGTLPCSAEVCEPVNCQFNQWSNWAAPQLTGLCQRNRNINVNNNQCGKPCKGKLIETKTCLPTWLTPQECALSDWGTWSHCPTMLAQRYRVRGVFRQAANGGSADDCKGSLRETASCMHAKPPLDCGFTDWTPWGACTRSCNGGWMYRTRQANHPQMERAGQPCAGELKQISQCNMGGCYGSSADCKVGLWSDYGVCYKHQTSRFRVITTAAKGGGAGCDDSLEQTTGCGDTPVDCQVSAWTAWDKCDLACGGGQQNRHRTIYRHAEHGGKACPEYNKQTQGCNLQACTAAMNCQIGQWSAWGGCSKQCGVGQKKRTRAILKLRSDGGTGCLENLEETLPCGTPPPPGQPCPPVDCKFGDWGPWNRCSKKCNTGFKTRNRTIAVPASPMGKPCNPEALAMSLPCNQDRCNGKKCIDGTWNAWEQWQTCSATCQGGLQWRHRTVATTANDCGTAAGGMQNDTRSCNLKVPCDANVNCEFSEWGQWQGCSAKCTGTTHRERTIKTYGAGNGGFCSGSLQDVAPCNPATGQQPPAECVQKAGGAKIDCVLGIWSMWKACTRTCGGGAAERVRTITQQAANGGKACTNSTREVHVCNLNPCPNGTHPVNCLWQEWNHWGACDKCNGVQQRHRQILRQAARGGQECQPGNATEVRGCEDLATRECGQTGGGQKFCMWMEWAQWSSCSVSCGTGGYRKRKRVLHATTVTPAPTTAAPAVTPATRRLDEDEMREIAAMRQARVAKQSQTHVQELVMAFAAGGASLFLVMAALRALPSRVSKNAAGVDPIETSSSERRPVLE